MKTTEHLIVAQTFRAPRTDSGEYPHDGEDWYDLFIQDYCPETQAHWLEVAAKNPGKMRVRERRIEEIDALPGQAQLSPAGTTWIFTDVQTPQVDQLVLVLCDGRNPDLMRWSGTDFFSGCLHMPARRVPVWMPIPGFTQPHP